jgi:hypothetical protein
MELLNFEEALESIPRNRFRQIDFKESIPPAYLAGGPVRPTYSLAS